MAYLAKSIKLCYTYDVLNRVTKRTKKSLTDDTVLSEENFTYDTAGNVTSVNGVMPKYVYGFGMIGKESQSPRYLRSLTMG